MSRDGNGSYSLPQAPFVSTTTIEAAKVNSDFSDLAAAMTQSISKDGQTTYTANQPMGGFKLTGLGAGTGNGESVRYNEFKAAFRSHLVGLQRTACTNTTITYSSGAWTEEGQSAVFAHAGGIINCATTGALGLDTGSLANSTSYHAFAIGKTDGTTSLLASTSASSPTLPSGYTLQRRIGSFRTNGSAQIIDFVQDGDEFHLVTAVEDLTVAAGTNPGTSAVTRTLTSIPTGIRVKARVIFSLFNGSPSVSYGNLTDLACADLAPASFPMVAQTSTSTGNVAWDFNPILVMTNTSSQVRSRVSFSSAAVAINIVTMGWIDRRGRDS